MIVLSRKGLDTSIGTATLKVNGKDVRLKIPHSLILSDGTMLSIPIPEIQRVGGENINRNSGVTYGDFLERFRATGHGDYKKVEGYLGAYRDIYCHQDPDIQPFARRKGVQIEAVFGIGGPQMKNPILKEMMARRDTIRELLFLFFGVFRHIDGDERPFHAIWGMFAPRRCLYLKSCGELEETLDACAKRYGVKVATPAQLGIEIASPGDKSRYAYHPHLVEGYAGGGDFLFVGEKEARDYATFLYRPSLRLSIEGEPMTHWRPDALPWCRRRDGELCAGMTPYCRAQKMFVDAGGQWQETAVTADDRERVWKAKMKKG